MIANRATHEAASYTRFVVAASVCVVGFVAVPALPANDWAATPYRAKAIILLDENPELCDAWRDTLSAAVIQVVHAQFGPFMQLEADVREAAAWRCDDLLEMSTGQVQDWEQAATSFDKLFVVIVESAARDIRLGCVEWDARTRSFSEVLIDESVPLTSLHRAVGTFLGRSFRPIGRLVNVGRTTVTLEMRAGALGTMTAVGGGLSPGEILQPVNCRLNRLGEITEDGITAVPWTMLRVVPWPDDQVPAPELVACAIDSGLRSPFRVRSSRRIERFALRVRPICDQTTFRFVSVTKPDEPLVGYELHGRRPDENGYDLVGTSDHRGLIVIPRGTQPYRMFYVKHGNVLLARLPCLLGLQSEVTLSLPNYTDRLKAEAFARGVEDDLLDAIVKRELVVAAFRRRLTADEISEADLQAAARLLPEIELLNRPDDLFREIQRREAMFRSSDPIVQKRIDMLFNDLRQTIRKSMDTNLVAKLQSELAEAQSRTRSDSADEVQPTK